MFAATLREHARAQAAPRPHHGLDRARRRLPGRHAHPDRHHGARLRPALRQGLRGHRRGRPHRGRLHRSPTGSAPAGPRSTPSVLDQVAQPSTASRAAEGSRQRLRAAHRHRRQGHRHQRRRPDHGLQHAGRRDAPRRRRDPLRPRAAGPDEVAIDAPAPRSTTSRSARRSGCCSAVRPQEFTVVGTVGFGGEKDLGGTTSAYFDAATAQRVLGAPGAFDAIDVGADDGVSAARARRAAGRGGARRAPRPSPAPRSPQENADAVKEDLKIVEHPVHGLRRHRAVRRRRSSSGTPSR